MVDANDETNTEMPGGAGGVPYGRRADDTDDTVWRAVGAGELAEMAEAYLRMVDVAEQITATVQKAKLAGEIAVQPDVTVEGKPTLHVWATDRGLKQFTRLWEWGMVKWLFRQVQLTLGRAMPRPGPADEPQHPPDVHPPEKHPPGVAGQEGEPGAGGDDPGGEHAA